VETSGVRLLFDAGISGRQAEGRLAEHGRDIRQVDALLISHDHRDHTCCMGVYQRKFGLPIYVTERTFDAADSYNSLGKVNCLHHFEAGETLHFDRVVVETIRTPHDSVDGVVFVVDDGRHRLGIFTDLGHVFAELEAVLETLDAVLIESNYDPDLLDDGPYPEPLKKRIRGPGGHLSNVESADLLEDCGRRLRWACLGHLSEQNNEPQLALQTHHTILGGHLPLHVASRYDASPVLEV
jgi:phosphoribosyl 1,2-cyclic phosphodiesterase